MKTKEKLIEEYITLFERTDFEQEFTELGKSYWGETGIYTKEYNKLYEEMVPDRGESKTLNGELIRAISRLGYEYNNNGNCNAREIETYTEEECCGTCDGSGEEIEYDEYDQEFTSDCSDCYGSGTSEEYYDEEPTITPMYDEFLELILKSVPNTKDDVRNVATLITQSMEYKFDDEEENKYDILFDKVIFYVLTNEDKELPNWYKH